MKNHSLSPPSKKQNSSHRNVRAVCFLLLFTGNIPRGVFQGQSPYQILINHPELDMSVRSMYTYIDKGLFTARNVCGASSHTNVF